MKRYILILLGLFATCLAGYARQAPAQAATGIAGTPTRTQNYVFTITPTTGVSSTSGLTSDNSLRAVQYFDGLGRPTQMVQIGITPDKVDLVNYQEYDAFSRESNSWLPAKASGNNGAFMPLATVRTKSSTTYSESMAYSASTYEHSPLNRITSQTGPGGDWYSNGKAVKTEYLVNNSSYVCRWYRASDTRTNAQVSITSGAVNYPAGQLYITKMTDEDGNISYEFKDKMGQVVLTRQMNSSTAHDTYYVYDSYGNLRAVLPPLAADAMATATTWAETHANLTGYAYLYKYDNRNRMIAKKLPGADWIYYVYDHADRVIFTQDGEMRAAGKWLFSIPDALGRVVLTGTCTNSMTYTANPLGTNVARATRNNATNAYKGYAVSGVTLTSHAVVSVNYYDDYNFMGVNSIPAATDANFKYETLSGYGTRYTGGYKGMLTGTMNAQMSQSGVTTSFLYSVMYYDERRRLVQVKSNNHLTGGIEKEYIGYNFSGQPLKRRLVHSATGKTTQTQLYEYTYDHAGRLTQVKHGLNTSTAGTVIALNTYDNLGRLKTQKKGSLPVTTYEYNVRSWTKSITNATLFTQTLYYNEVYGGSAKRYNGNVSAMSWKAGSETLRGYAFGYDGLSRLTSANYLLNGSVNSNNTVSGITYDKHGNMRTIQRRGKTTTSAYGIIDNLTMTYSGNQLTNVTDAGTTVSIAESNDFKKGSSTNPGYAYNKNGAMNKDLNKSISAITYNLLNLPARVTISGVNHDYTYSADGRKLKVVQGSTNRDYAGSVIYENSSLKRILIDGGYIEGGVYYYYINDHLGNTRVVASGTGTIQQRNHYYPFGMPFADTASAEQDKQPYKYGGKEFERANGLKWFDFEARQMDPALGRFTTMDPLAEKYYSMTPYGYCGNNPMRFVDPTGMFYTDYEINKRGYIKAITEPDNKPDRLFGTNQATGKRESITVNDKTILPTLAGESNLVNENKHVTGKRKVTITRKGNETSRKEEISYPKVYGKAATTDSKVEAKAVFEFAAKTSEVEWGVSVYKNDKAVVGTLNEGSLAPNFSPLGEGYEFGNQTYRAHSHGGKVPSYDFVPSAPDINNARALKKINPNAQSWLYMPQNPNNKWLELK